jgi:hypothetical protein
MSHSGPVTRRSERPVSPESGHLAATVGNQFLASLGDSSACLHSEQLITSEPWATAQPPPSSQYEMRRKFPYVSTRSIKAVCGFSAFISSSPCSHFGWTAKTTLNRRGRKSATTPCWIRFGRPIGTELARAEKIASHE